MSEPKEVAEQEMNKVLGTNGDDVTDVNKKPSAMVESIALKIVKTKDEISDENKASDDKDIVADGEVVDELEKDGRAKKLLVEGSTFLLANDYGSAVNCLSECCTILASIYGELGSECGEPFYLYGVACLELGKREHEKASQKELVNKAAEIISISSDETEEDEEIINTEEEKEDVANAEKDVKVAVVDDVQQSKDDEVERVVTSSAIVEEGVTSDEDDNEEANETGEEMENFQLAWEVLEIAKKVFERDGDLKRMVDVYLKLGEVSILSGNYSTAIEDLTRAMDLANDHPSISEQVVLDIYYQLAVANQFAHQYDAAIKFGEITKKLVEGKLSRIVGRSDKETELLELHEFLKAVEDILIDIRDEKEAALAKQSVSMGSSVSNSESGTSSSSSKTSLTVDDISHLVRRKDTVKRKREDDSE